jgi:hypothetical protein
VTVGSYKAVAITWDNSQANAPVVEVGLNLNNVDHCWKSTAVDMSICDCNTTTIVLRYQFRQVLILNMY